MTLQQLPTEAQCLVDSIQADAANLVSDIRALLFVPEILTIGSAVGDLHNTMLAARMQQFKAQRLQCLVHEQAETLRLLFSLTSCAVDQLRLLAGQMQVPADDGFACMSELADMQANIVTLFDGEEFPG